MPGLRNVISTLTDSGEEVMGPEILLWHYPENNIMNGSLLTVESNHFCVLKSRGAILQIYETGQYPVQTPDRPIFGSMQQAFYGGQSPWQYEALYINRAKLILKTTGMALSREMLEPFRHSSVADDFQSRLKICSRRPPDRYSPEARPPFRRRGVLERE